MPRAYQQAWASPLSIRNSSRSLASGGTSRRRRRAGTPCAAVAPESSQPTRIRTHQRFHRIRIPNSRKARSYSPMAASMSPRLKASAANLPTIDAVCWAVSAKHFRRTKQLCGLLVLAAGHDDVAQVLQHAESGAPVKRCAQGDAVLLFSHLERMLVARSLWPQLARKTMRGPCVRPHRSDKRFRLARWLGVAAPNARRSANALRAVLARPTNPGMPAALCHGRTHIESRQIAAR